MTNNNYTKLKNFIKRNWIIPLIIVKSLLSGITQLAISLVYLGLLGWVYYFVTKEYPEVVLSTLPPLLGNIGNLIIDNVFKLILIISIVYFYFEYKE